MDTRDHVSGCIPYEYSLLAYLDRAYGDGLVELEVIDTAGERYRLDLCDPHPQTSEPDFPDARPWRLVRTSDGAEVLARYLAMADGLSAEAADGVASVRIVAERYCDEALGQRLARALGVPTGTVRPSDVAAHLETSPYRARLQLASGFRVEKPWWTTKWQVRGPDARPWSGEHPTLAAAVAEAVAAGKGGQGLSLAQRRWLAADGGLDDVRAPASRCGVPAFGGGA